MCSVYNERKVLIVPLCRVCFSFWFFLPLPSTVRILLLQFMDILSCTCMFVNMYSWSSTCWNICILFICMRYSTSSTHLLYLIILTRLAEEEKLRNRCYMTLHLDVILSIEFSRNHLCSFRDQSWGLTDKNDLSIMHSFISVQAYGTQHTSEEYADWLTISFVHLVI
jgi:hypothetical protein